MVYGAYCLSGACLTTMKAIVKYIYDTENIDQVREMDDMRNGSAYKNIIIDFDNYLRDKLKYSELSDSEYKVYEETRSMLWNLLNESNLDLD